MEPTIIKVDHIKKQFKINKRPSSLFGHMANLFIPKYEIRQAVDDVSFEIKKGEAVGFIGPNGAGKSTTIKMLSGILYPDGGNIEIAGYIPYRDRKKYVAHIGVVFGQKSQLTWDLPVIDSFELLKHIYKIPETLYKKNVAAFVELLDMASFIEQPVRQLSLGQRMRADIAASLLHSPEIVFFDEPTIGLDVVAKERIREFVRYINHEQGVTIIFTTHDMQDIEKVCNRLILIDKGKKIYDDSVAGLLESYGREKGLIVEFEGDYTITPIENVKIEALTSRKKKFVFNPHLVSTKSLLEKLMSEYEVKDLSVKEMDVEDVVRQIYERNIEI